MSGYDEKDIEIICPYCGWKLLTEYGKIQIHGPGEVFPGVCPGTGLSIQEAQRLNQQKKALKKWGEK
jgi:hypothetical protein